MEERLQRYEAHMLAKAHDETQRQDQAQRLPDL
jgi:hypothetical protein